MIYLIVGTAFVSGMIALARYLANRDEQGYWDKEGHGTNRPRPGVHYRPLEVPAKPPFD